MSEAFLENLYATKTPARPWKPFVLRPDAISTSRYDDVARLLRNEKGRLLEVGSSRGELLAALADQFDELVGMEISQSKVDLGNKAIQEHCPKYASKIRMFKGNTEQRTPLEDASFDVVVACAVLEHVVDIFGMMDEIARVCRPGGCLVLTVPNIGYLMNVAKLALGMLPSTGGPVEDMEACRREGWDGGHLHYFTKRSLALFLRATGFEPEVWTGDGRWAKLRRWRQSFVGNLTVRARRTSSSSASQA